MPSRWKPAPLLPASAVVHGAALLGTIAVPAAWPWAVGVLVANHALLAGAGLWPSSHLLGPNLTRLPHDAVQRREIALTIDDGPDPDVTPRVLDLLDAANVKASFFCIGRIAEKHPAVCREIVQRGHRVENHGYAHSNAFSLFGPGAMRRDIARAQATLSDITGQAPRFFRATAGLRNPFLDPVLHGLGLQLATWNRRAYDTRNGDAERVFQRLAGSLQAGDIVLMHDGHCARTPAGKPVILAVLPRLLQTIAERQLHPVSLQTSSST
ncbi:polysaccharide deacetylase family protein [Hydrogenophaga sp.]|uniref:polysaccharide deacetylase family protein n=1 Tax=Hydrogenophaga sp. TaxID=1904254 RepID=UPI00271A88E6|nr:polysaccharide deacetylase family protein [Hydrogenophaga sp.]MDO9433895.1 polysaccharide deacetylase family protein [Hydrogenophaga sp.]